MGKRTGMIGSVQLEGSALDNDAEFNVNIITGTTESQGIGDVWKAKYSVGKSWSGHISAFYDPDDAVLAALLTAGTSSTYDDTHYSALSLYDNASAFFTGSVIITSVTVNKSVGNVDKVEIDFEGAGAVAYS